MTAPHLSPSPSAAAELWGGLECSVVRIGAALRDQFRDTGHHDRIADLEAAAGLGLSRLRYPVSWERISPDQPEACDWAWHDERLAELRRLGIAPIAGLVHHGSGPGYTCLLDEAFPEKLAAFAARAARRYPWITDWTPVNEPLTTARFSGLYGHWAPHQASEGAFLRMLALQCRGIQRAMQAIRAEIPQARLVQTEDLGRTFATAKLHYQAEYENRRRWLSLDLLLGRVDEDHPFHPRLLRAGVSPAALAALREGVPEPVVLGFNHYVTSERYLDHRTALYPAATYGGNGRDAYADTEAVRVPAVEGQTGWLPRLREAVARYPDHAIAVTEAHLGCPEEAEQVRWLAECWQAAATLRAEGTRLLAVTPWTLFGAVDWCSLMTRRRNRYEPGCFDIRGPAPRRTRLGDAVHSLGHRGHIADEAAATPGWWRRPERFHTALKLAG
jgi:dTDP-4-dehydrorhamnose reductase